MYVFDIGWIPVKQRYFNSRPNCFISEVNDINANHLSVLIIYYNFRTVLSWNVKGLEDINEKSLAIFKYLEPKIDVLVRLDLMTFLKFHQIKIFRL